MTVLIVFSIANFIMNAILVTAAAMYAADIFEKRVEEKTEETVERAMEEDKKDVFDEGFENIMSFSINGVNGFERSGE